MTSRDPTPPHYQHRVGGVLLDPYRIARVYGMTDDALFSAMKKILAAGKRGAKDKARDVQDAIDALMRWQEMEAEDASPMAVATESLDAPMTATEVVDLRQHRVSPDPAARLAELERELEQSEARADARLRNMESARDRVAELERERDEAAEASDRESLEMYREARERAEYLKTAWCVANARADALAARLRETQFN